METLSQVITTPLRLLLLHSPPRRKKKTLAPTPAAPLSTTRTTKMKTRTKTKTKTMNIHVLRVAVNLYNSPAAASLCLVVTLSVCAASAHLLSPTFVVSGCASGVLGF